MKYTEDEWRKAFAQEILAGAHAETDEDGQLVFYTGLYFGKDDVVQDDMDETWGDA